jgi:hypothetical protein
MDIPYPFPIGEWHHVAAVGTGESLIVYLDGKQAGKRDGPTQNYGKTEMQFNIGGRIFDSMGNHIIGMIDEVYVYNKALSPSEIESMARISTDKPEVSITKPAEGDAFEAPGDIEITVDAKSEDSPLKPVDLYVNKQFFRADQEEPYSFMLHVEIPGDYELSARAINEAGYWTEDTVYIRVSSNSDTEDNEPGAKPKNDDKGKGTKNKDASSALKRNEDQFASGKHMHSSEYETRTDAVKYAIEHKVQNKSNKKSAASTSDNTGADIRTKNMQQSKTQGSVSASGKGGGVASLPRPSEPPGALTSLRFTDVRGPYYTGAAGSMQHPTDGAPILAIVIGIVCLSLVAGGVIYFVLARQRRNGKSPRMNAHA